MQRGWSQQMLQGWMGCAGVGAAGLPWDAGTDTQSLLYNVPDGERICIKTLFIKQKNAPLE